MRILMALLWGVVVAVTKSRADLVAENAALRQQVLALLAQLLARPKIRRRDRVFWVLLSRLWRGWRAAVLIVKPATVVGWHRAIWRRFWRWRSRPGRPTIPRHVIAEIRRMSTLSPRWGAPRIRGELAKLGFPLAPSTIARYMVKPERRRRKPGDQSWRTFLRNHVRQTVAVDFMTVATAGFRVVYVFVVLSLARRKILHVNVTAHPTAEWTAQQLREAFPWGDAPKYLQRDNGGNFGEVYKRQVEAMGIEELVSAPRSPWQNGYVERVIGSIRRDCLDHMIICGENHLREILAEYVNYYNRSRTHLGLDGDCPEHREVELPEAGPIRAVPVLGGLHHRYRRRAA